MKTGEQSRNSSSDQSAVRQIVHRLINVRAAERDDAKTSARAATSACDYLYEDLSRWVGRDGCHTLFMRALAESRIEHPLLEEIELRQQAESYVEGAPQTILAYGDPATADALEAMLVVVVELLGRLIGEDMATKLIELTLARPRSDEGRRVKRKEEA